MTAALTYATLMTKAARACVSARALFDLDDRAEEVRQVADYSPTPVAVESAREVVDHAGIFLAAVRDRFGMA